jgi:hypothetical protein
MKLCKCAAIFVGLLANWAVASGAPTEIPTVKLSKFEENLLRTVPTGGAGILVGATLVGDELRHLFTPALFLPSSAYPEAGTLCIETVSIDGSYSSHGEIPGSDLRSYRGAVRFAPNNPDASGREGTKWAREIQAYGPRNLAVLASIGACGSQENRNARTFVVVDRSAPGTPGPENRHYRLYVNPLLADEVDVLYRGRDNREMRAVCLPADSEFNSVAFSQICELNGPFTDVTHVEIVPSKFGKPLQKYIFNLLYAQEH